jgi:hypothetical protein
MIKYTVMANKYLSVTNSVTQDYLNEISTKGYDFFWNVATSGYKWVGKETLVFDKEVTRSLFFELYAPDVLMSPRKFRYNKDAILYDAKLNRYTYFMQEIHPEDEDRDSPWLVEKGAIELQQRQLAQKTRGKDWKVVPAHQYRPLSLRTLHRQFANLRTESLETEVPRFANKYGLLGRTVYLQTRHGQTPAVVQGESIHRWCTEIDRLGVLLALWDLIRYKKAGKLGQIIIWHPNSVEIRMKWQGRNGWYEVSRWEGEQKEVGFGHINESVASRTFEPDFFGEYQWGEVIGPAWYYLGGKLNSYLHLIRPKVVGYHEPEVYHVPRTLLDALWLLFMLEVQGKTKVARCQYCDNWFELERSTKKYCSGNCRRLAFYHRSSRKQKEAQNNKTHTS